MVTELVYNFLTDKQVEKIDPLLKWVQSEFGFKPVVYTSFFGGKQDEGLVEAIENVLKKADDCELAAIDAIAAAGHSLVIAIGMLRGRLQIEEAIELIRLEEDFQVLLSRVALPFLFFKKLCLLFFHLHSSICHLQHSYIQQSGLHIMPLNLLF